jgi:hypothetical protein
VQRFGTSGVAPRRTSAALQLSPAVGIARELSDRAYLYARGSASTYLFRTEDSQTQRSTFGPSFALRFAVGAGYRF